MSQTNNRGPFLIDGQIWWTIGNNLPTEPLVDSGIDSHQCYKNKKAHIIMGLIAFTGGEGGIRTRVRVLP